MSEIKYKICNECKTEKPAQRAYFYKAVSNTDGLNSICRECKRTNYKDQIQRRPFKTQNKDYSCMGYMNGIDEIYC